MCIQFLALFEAALITQVWLQPYVEILAQPLFREVGQLERPRLCIMVSLCIIELLRKVVDELNALLETVCLVRPVQLFDTCIFYPL